MDDVEKIRKMKEDAIKQGGVFAKLYFQIFGKSEKAVIDLAKGFSASLVKTPGIKLGATEIAPPEKADDYYSTYVEAYLVFERPSDLLEVVLDTTPFSIEVIEPENLTINAGKLTELLYTISSYVFEIKKEVFENNPKQAYLMKKMAEERLKLGKKVGGKKDGTS